VRVVVPVLVLVLGRRVVVGVPVSFPEKEGVARHDEEQGASLDEAQGLAMEWPRRKWGAFTVSTTARRSST
jgi:hypothetical protein